MKLILKLAWRNLFRNWRRSLITIIAVFFASFLAVGMRGMQIGTYDANIRNMVNIYNGIYPDTEAGIQRKSLTE